MCKGRSLVSEMYVDKIGMSWFLLLHLMKHPFMGPLLRSLVCRTSYSSVLIIVSFSMERYLAICHPLYSHTMSGFKRAVRIIALVWVISLVAAFPYAIFTKVNYIDRPLNSGNYLNQSAFCAVLDSNIYPKVGDHNDCYVLMLEALNPTGYS